MQQANLFDESSGEFGKNLKLFLKLKKKENIILLQFLFLKLFFIFSTLSLKCLQ